MSQSFEDLEVWKPACRLAVRLHKLLENSRSACLRDQMQRAAVSIGSNIAKGCERGGKDFARFLAISRGSAAELRTQLYIAAQIGIIDATTMRDLVDEAKRISKMLFSLGKALKLRKDIPNTENQTPNTAGK